MNRTYPENGHTQTTATNPIIRNITDIVIGFEILQRNTTTGPTTTAHEELDTARTVISRQTKAIAIRDQKIETQQMMIEYRVKAEEALSHAEDKTEAAHTKWIECKEKLEVAGMERMLTYIVLAGNRRIACPACDRHSITVSELIEENIELVGNRFGEMRRIQEVITWLSDAKHDIAQCFNDMEVMKVGQRGKV